MTTEQAKKILYKQWQEFLENNLDYAGVSDAYKMAFEALERSRWIPTAERLPEMHKEDGLLEKYVEERSDEVLVTIKDNNNGSVVTHSKCELWDGKWHGDIFKWLDASKCNYTVTAWRELPEPYKAESE